MISLNERAEKIALQMISDADALGVALTPGPEGASIVDTGIKVDGSLEAGRLFSEACMGGLGRVRFCSLELGGQTMPGLEVTVSQPVLACMAAQYAGWALNVPGKESSKPYFAMGSGPARALNRGEPLFEEIAYRDSAKVAVLALETDKLPPAEVVRWVAEKCNVSPDKLYLIVAPTASLVGSVQIAARVVETGLHKMHEVGFDINTVISGFGTCPVPPVAGDDLRAIGRTNDAVLYGGRVWYTVKTEDALIEEVIEKLPSSSSRDYGTSFYDLFKRYDGDFYKIDPLLFSPAEITINNVTSGRTFQAGSVNAELVRQGLLG